MFDTTLQIMDAQVVASDDPNSEVLQLVVVVGLPTPFAGGPGQPSVVLTLGVYRIPMDHDLAVSTGEDLTREGEKLRKHSDISVATSLQDVNQAAQSISRFTGGK